MKSIGKSLIAFTPIALLLLLAACATTNKGLANTELNNFKSQVRTDENHSLTDLTLNSAQIDQLTLGQPIKIYAISLDSIRAWHPFEAQSALTDLQQNIYPILLGDTVVSGETFALKNGNWQFKGYGDQLTMRAFKIYKQSRVFANPPYLVRIPSFSLNFCGYKSDSTYFMALINSYSFDSIIPNHQMIMGDVMHQLKPQADALNIH